MRAAFPRVYRSFEEFEREELNKLDMAGSLDDMVDAMFAEELDFEGGSRRSRGRNADEDE
jgi:hypothetical protein